MSASGLRQEFLVVLDDGSELKARCDLRDTTAWERAHKKGWFDQDRPSIQMMTWRCWNALTRQGDWTKPYTEFDRQVIDLDALDDDDADPTRRAPGDEPSSP